MKINRVDTLDDALRGPAIEVSALDGETFVVVMFLTRDGNGSDGPFPTAKSAEEAGIAAAERAGIDELNVVHTTRG